MSTEATRLQLWADSFHEGVWAAEGVLNQWPDAAVTRTHRLGFIPHYQVQIDDSTELEIEVFGGYANWERLPGAIRTLLEWGKPDIVAYCPDSDRVLFAIEETAAVPTGNQALQRCERMHGASISGIPFWYLLSEYGVHVDEGVRRASPWPALMALALTETYKVPNVVLLYSSRLSPEDYAAGDGLEQLFRALARLARNFAEGRPMLEGLDEHLVSQFRSMLRFIHETHANVTDFLPGEHLLSDPGTAITLAKIAAGNDDPALSIPVLDWPRFAQLPARVKRSQTTGGFLKSDDFLASIEALRGAGAAYTLSSNAGSRPQPEESLRAWIRHQESIHASAPTLTPAVPFQIELGSFPASSSGFRHVTTALNTLYLIDNAQSVFDALERDFSRLAGKLPERHSEPALLYVSNSISPRRVWGDPFTGQFAAFSWIFGGSSDLRRTRFVYFPHQSHGIMTRLTKSQGKGARIYLSRADYIVFHGGAVFSTGEGDWV